MFKCTEINLTPEKIIENFDALALLYSIYTISFLSSIGLTFELTELDNENPANRAQALKRLCEIDSLLKFYAAMVHV